MVMRVRPLFRTKECSLLGVVMWKNVAIPRLWGFLASFHSKKQLKPWKDSHTTSLIRHGIATQKVCWSLDLFVKIAPNVVFRMRRALISMISWGKNMP